MSDTTSRPSVRSWRVDLGRALSGGLGSVAALTIAGWPSSAPETAWVGLVGLVTGLAIAFSVEYFLRLHAEVKRLHAVERDLENERKQRAEERRLYERQVEIAKREAAINAVDVEVWGGAFNEAQTTGHFLPVSAILARRDMFIKARNLDVPVPPP
ncbi:MAG: hypothetical protein M3198_13355 [Actinomycetota bacterium]|nr:hypothetical protein [Actinomycetota bacterium]